MVAYGLRLTTAPTLEPVTRAEMKLHLRVDADFAADDALIDGLSKAARLHVEQVTNRSLVTQTWQLTLDEFSDYVRLPRSPVQSVSSVTYTDTAGAAQTLNASLYRVDLYSSPPRVTPAYGQIWPVPRYQAGTIAITFIAGYGAPAAVPEDFKVAIKLLCGHWYANREAVGPGAMTALPMALESLLGMGWDGAYASGG